MEKFEPENVENVSVKTVDLGTILGISDVRIRQLAMQGILQSSARGSYPLADSVQRYLRYIDGRQDDEVRSERARLLKAQREALESKTGRTKATASAQTYQTAAVRVLAAVFYLESRLVATWLFTELQPLLPGPEARRVAGLVNGWLMHARRSTERRLVVAVEDLNRQGKMITSERDLGAAADTGDGLTEHFASDPEAMRESEQAMQATIEALDAAHDAFNPPINPSATNRHGGNA